MRLVRHFTAALLAAMAIGLGSLGFGAMDLQAATSGDGPALVLPPSRDGDPLIIFSPLSEKPAPTSPDLMSWPCLDRPGCGDAQTPEPQDLMALDPAMLAELEAEPERRPAVIPLPAALALLGLGMSAMGVLMHRARTRS